MAGDASYRGDLFHGPVNFEILPVIPIVRLRVSLGECASFPFE